MFKKLTHLLSQENWEIKELGEVFEIAKSNRDIEGKRKNIKTLERRDLNSLRSIYFSQWEPSIDSECQISWGTFEKNDILLVSVDWNTDSIGKAFMYLGEERYNYGGDIFLLKTHHNPRFLIHLLNSQCFRDQIRQHLIKKYTKGIALHINTPDLKKIKIPLPPEETQNRIVQFLDELYGNHLKLEKELMDELEERKIQYEEHKKLLFSGNHETKTIKEISRSVFKGFDIKDEDLSSGSQPTIKFRNLLNMIPLFFDQCPNSADPQLLKTKKYCEYGDLLVFDSEKAKTYLGNQKCLVASSSIAVIKHNLNPKYLQYLWTTDLVKDQINKNFIPRQHLSPKKETLENILIPIPSPEEQEIMVRKLDEYYSLMLELEDNIQQLIKENIEQYEAHKNLIFTPNNLSFEI